ncbi:hypothetical protein, partial [Vibrio ponticus]|uniref:hypothetical protein n=1 Tax=Vibrio ponticus TaxID=265668 RepID=UPI001C850316
MQRSFKNRHTTQLETKFFKLTNRRASLIHENHNKQFIEIASLLSCNNLKTSQIQYLVPILRLFCS